jgi:transcriptional regulator with XRE-family HTH domain
MLFFKHMSGFSERLRLEIDYACLNQKELAAKAGIKKRALDMYLGTQGSMPPADTAVKIAAVLGVSVEYLVTGREGKSAIDIAKYSKFIKFRDLLEDLVILPDEIYMPVRALIGAFAKQEREKKPESGTGPMQSAVNTGSPG